jgi:pyrroline-5-carboxylate reductase
MNNLRIALIGGGNMGRALVGGLLTRGADPRNIFVGEAHAPFRESLTKHFGVHASADNVSVVGNADAVVLAVKPQDMQAATLPLRDALAARKPLVISVAAGLRADAIATWCGPGIAVVRAMPNRPALVGAGVTGAYAPSGVAPAHRQLATQILEAVGEVVWVDDEAHLDAVTALSGSGPAYFFLLAEEMIRGGIKLGLAPEVARRLSVGTLFGAGQLAHRSDGDVARLRTEITSKGGTTEAALKVFGSAGFDDVVERAVEAAASRSRELAAQFGKTS